MCVSNIVLHPDAGLRCVAQNVEVFDDAKVVETIDALIATMKSYEHCVGLAANQIGSDLNIFVADASKNKREKSEHGFVVVVNPLIISAGESELMREGCMSVPDLTGNVLRSKHVILKGFDRNGLPLELSAFDFEARVFQHEVDHLKGKLFLDRVKSARDVFSRKHYRSAKEQ